MAATRHYMLAARFVYDHWSRDLPEAPGAVSAKLRDSGSRVEVALDEVGYQELLSDATYYAEEMGGAGFDDGGLIRSAAAVARALRKAGPVAGPAEARAAAAVAFAVRLHSDDDLFDRSTVDAAGALQFVGHVAAQGDEAGFDAATVAEARAIIG